MESVTIMFVDDEENVLKSMERMFRHSGHSVLTAASGDEALEKMDKEKVDILITDHRMPNMTGIELCREVKNRYPFTIRMILSAYADTSEVLSAVEQEEVYRLLHKPSDITRIMDVVDRTVEQIETINSFKELMDTLKPEDPEMAYDVDYTGGMIRVGTGKPEYKVNKNTMTCLLHCLSGNDEKKGNIEVISTVLARQNGALSLNADMGAGLKLTMELPIREEHEE